jgi:hypothetical protein
MSDLQACCAHNRVVSKHIDHADGSRSEYWECDYGCGQRFQPVINQEPFVPKPNPHIIVGEGRRCLCGLYNDGGDAPVSIGCGQIISAVKTLSLVVDDLTEECS